MTKPKDFIFNSDYLALAQTDKNEFTAIFPAESFPGGYTYDRTQDFTVPYTPGAIDMFLLSLNGGDYTLGNAITIESHIYELYIFASRIDARTIRVRLHEFNSQTSGYNMPMQTVKVKLTSFAPPNLF